MGRVLGGQETGSGPKWTMEQILAQTPSNREILFVDNDTESLVMGVQWHTELNF